jgi:hypothetical protein
MRSWLSWRRNSIVFPICQNFLRKLGRQHHFWPTVKPFSHITNKSRISRPLRQLLTHMRYQPRPPCSTCSLSSVFRLHRMTSEGCDQTFPVAKKQADFAMNVRNWKHASQSRKPLAGQVTKCSSSGARRSRCNGGHSGGAFAVCSGRFASSVAGRTVLGLCRLFRRDRGRPLGGKFFFHGHSATGAETGALLIHACLSRPDIRDRRTAEAPRVASAHLPGFGGPSKARRRESGEGDRESRNEQGLADGSGEKRGHCRTPCQPPQRHVVDASTMPQPDRTNCD